MLNRSLNSSLGELEMHSTSRWGRPQGVVAYEKFPAGTPTASER
jgi:hypothetical protein